MPDLDPHQARPITPEGVANIRARIITALGGLDAVPAGASIEEVLDLLLQEHDRRQQLLTHYNDLHGQWASLLTTAMESVIVRAVPEIRVVRDGVRQNHTP